MTFLLLKILRRPLVLTIQWPMAQCTRQAPWELLVALRFFHQKTWVAMVMVELCSLTMTSLLQKSGRSQITDKASSIITMKSGSIRALTASRQPYSESSYGALMNMPLHATGLLHFMIKPWESIRASLFQPGIRNLLTFFTSILSF